MKKLAIVLSLIPAIALGQSQQRVPRALDATSITSGTAITAVAGPANGCNVQSSVDIIVNVVGVAGTSASGTSQLNPSGSVFQCGSLPQGVSLSVNCSGGGSCTIYGIRW